MNEDNLTEKNEQNDILEPKVLIERDLDTNKTILNGNERKEIIAENLHIHETYNQFIEGDYVEGGGYQEKVNIDSIQDNRSVNIDSQPPELEASEKALTRLHESAKLNLEQLEKNYNQVRKESSRFFWLMLCSSGLGFTVIIFSVILFYFGRATAGMVGTIASTIPNATSLLFFRKEKELRKSIERYHGYLIQSHKTSLMIDVAETITNLDDKDHIKKTIIYNVLEVNIQEGSNYLEQVIESEERLLQKPKDSDIL